MADRFGIERGTPARVWRLDGVTANTSEILTCIANARRADRRFGVNQIRRGSVFRGFTGSRIHDSRALSALREQIDALPSPPCISSSMRGMRPRFIRQSRVAALKPMASFFSTWMKERQRVKLWNSFGHKLLH